jgi:hypothetical protein
MRPLLLLLVIALATNAFGDDLTGRLEPLGDPDQRILAAVYDRYPSGQPRRVAATFGNVGEGKLLLVRFPDSDSGKPLVLDRQELESGPGEVRIETIIDPKDIVVELDARHGSSAIVDRVLDDRLVRIADSFGEAIDLDGDGVPEIISGGYAGGNKCGASSSVWLARWNGKRFIGDERNYVTVLSPGAGAESDEVLLSASKHYVVRRFGRGRVTLDDEAIEPGKPFKTEEDCHVIALHGAGPKTRVFLEELP